MLVNLMKKRYEEHIKEKIAGIGNYKPDKDDFEAYIEYTFANPGETKTYKGFLKFKEGRKEDQC